MNIGEFIREFEEWPDSFPQEWTDAPADVPDKEFEPA